MRTIVIGLIFVAVLLAGGTAYLLSNYLKTQEATIAAQAPKEFAESVLVANADLPAGTVINSSNVTWQPWPEDGVTDDFITKKSSDDPVADLEKDKNVVRRGLSKGDPIVKRKLHSPTNSPSFMRGTLKPGMRAVAISTSPISASGGFVLPGDRVDILLQQSLLSGMLQKQLGTDKELPLINTITEVIMEDVLILAINGQVAGFEGGSVPAQIILVEVTPKDAEKLITAQKMGQLSILLRSLESVDKYAQGEGPGYTTDIEVSPTLSNPGAVLAGKSTKKDTTKSVSQQVTAPVTVRAAPTGGQNSGKIKVFE